MPLQQDTPSSPQVDDPFPHLANASGVERASVRDERASETDVQYLGVELTDHGDGSENIALRAGIVTALIVLFTLDVKYATEINITSLYIVVIFLTLSLQRVGWVLGVTIASLLLNICALRWNMMYPPDGWSFRFAINHLLMAAGGQVPAGVLAYRSIVTNRYFERNRRETMNRQRALYERERAARTAEQEARIRERRAADDLRLHAEELTRIIESEREARLRENAAWMQAKEAMGERDHIRNLTESFQRTLLPQIPTGIADGQLALGALYQPAIQEMSMGGDFYDATLLSNGMIGLVIGDVAGHGVEAAAQTAFVTTTLRAFATEDPLSPGRVIARVNRSLTLDHHFDGFVSLFYGVYDPATGMLRYTNAGHEPPILIHNDGEYEGLNSTGLVVGVNPEALYEEAEVQFRQGECIVLLTDGMTEARGAVSRRMLRWDGVAKLAVKQCRDVNHNAKFSAEQMAHALYRGALDFVDENGAAPNGPGLTDDVALLVVVALKDGAEVSREAPVVEELAAV